MKHWVDTSSGGLLVPKGVIGSLVSVAGLTWFMLLLRKCMDVNKGNNKITELRTILQMESQNSQK
jgi:hypothetical protein